MPRLARESAFRRGAWTLALALAWCAPTAAAAALAPYKGSGSTPIGADGSASAVRSKALAKARKAALEAALAEITGPIDKAAKKTVLKSADAWTGAYRVLTEREEGSIVTIEVEVDVDVARQRKRLTTAPSVGSQPLYRVDGVEVAAGCGDARTLGARVEDELGGATAKDGTPVRVRVECTSLGAVPHTFLHAAKVELVAETDGRLVARIEHDGFAADAPTTIATAVAEAAGELASKLAVHRRGTVALRVESALPAARVRRLERALTQSVVGVARVELVRVDPRGAIVLRVHGQLDAGALGQALEQLQTPGLRASVVALEGPDALSIRLQ
jgi:hypothetical protein